MTARPVIAATPRTVRVTIPIRTCTEGNAKEFWRTKAARAKRQRRQVAEVLPWHLRAARGLDPRIDREPVVVTLTRIAPSAGLDPHDNLPGSLKHVVDEVARALGIDDRSHLVSWRYEQRRSKRADLGTDGGYAVEIRIARAAP